MAGVKSLYVKLPFMMKYRRGYSKGLLMRNEKGSETVNV